LTLAACAEDSQKPLFVNSNRNITVKNTVGSSAVVFCACDTIQLLSVAFHLVRFVYKFYFRLIPNDTFS
jgi:hypothetical protein